MRKILTAAVLLSVFWVSLTADVHRGKKYYMKELKGKLHMNGADFVVMHTQAEWKALFADGAKGFIEEFSARYPKYAKYFHSRRFRKKMPDLRDFAVEYASDSGKVPSCGDDSAPAPVPVLDPSGVSKTSPF